MFVELYDIILQYIFRPRTLFVFWSKKAQRHLGNEQNPMARKAVLNHLNTMFPGNWGLAAEQVSTLKWGVAVGERTLPSGDSPSWEWTLLNGESLLGSVHSPMRTPNWGIKVTLRGSPSDPKVVPTIAKLGSVGNRIELYDGRSFSKQLESVGPLGPFWENFGAIESCMLLGTRAPPFCGSPTQWLGMVRPSGP